MSFSGTGSTIIEDRLKLANKKQRLDDPRSLGSDDRILSKRQQDGFCFCLSVMEKPQGPRLFHCVVAKCWGNYT